MKIKKFKLELKLKNIYDSLKEKEIKITPEVETLVTLVKKKLEEIIEPSVIFESYSPKDNKITEIVKYLQLPKNVVEITFCVATLGSKVEEFISSCNEEIEKNIANVILYEYLNSAAEFVIKLLKEKSEENVEPGSIFLVQQELYKDILELLSAEKIGVSFDLQKNQLFPFYTTITYCLWFKTKNK
jgi:hypothetical protein